jgi:hypothetical protein
MDIEPIVVHGWKFELTNNQLSITSEQDNNQHVQLNARAAYSLLDYLYRYRNNLYEEDRQETSEEVERRKAEFETQKIQDNLMSG